MVALDVPTKSGTGGNLLAPKVMVRFVKVAECHNICLWRNLGQGFLSVNSGSGDPLQTLSYSPFSPTVRDLGPHHVPVGRLPGIQDRLEAQSPLERRSAFHAVPVTPG
ncbi:hypothetical protein P7K49_002691, partial [Saguinus oedipus]